MLSASARRAPRTAPACCRAASSSVAIARAGDGTLAFLADEPTGDLDEHTAESLHDLLREMHRERAHSIIATHNPRLAAACDRAAPRGRQAREPADPDRSGQNVEADRTRRRRSVFNEGLPRSKHVRLCRRRSSRRPRVRPGQSRDQAQSGQAADGVWNRHRRHRRLLTVRGKSGVRLRRDKALVSAPARPTRPRR